MNSKEKILAAIKNNKPSVSTLPDLPDFQKENFDLIQHFQHSIESGKGFFLKKSKTASYKDIFQQYFPEAKIIASTLPDFKGNINLKNIENPNDLKNIDLAIIPSALGVVENGAVWVDEKDIVHRVLPFITQHLVIVLQKENIVQNMHQAYQKIKVDETGFGVFIAGPSKTADIEQSLVIGAQGARSFTVILI